MSKSKREGATTQRLSRTDDRHELFSKPEMQAVTKVEAALLRGAREYFDSANFTEIVVPHLTRATGACENVDTLFEVDFFGEKGYLAQTGQLYLEVLTSYHDRVWCYGPSFRAEPRADDRHLAEFILIELEFAGDFQELLSHMERVITAMVEEARESCDDELQMLGADTEALERVGPPFDKITYTEAVDELEEFGVEWGDDLKDHHEARLLENHGSEPLIVTHYPEEIKFFNMRRNRDNPEVVNSADLLLPDVGEAIGAAEREYEHGRLTERLLSSVMYEQLKKKGGSLKDFEWYLDFYKNNEGRLHSGCGIGLNRVTRFVTGLDDVRAATTFPVNKKSIL